MEAYKEKEVVLEERRQKHSGALSRSQQSPQLMDIDQSRNYEQT